MRKPDPQRMNPLLEQNIYTTIGPIAVNIGS